MPSKHRRGFLRASGALIGVGLAGCLDDADEATDDRSTTIIDDSESDTTDDSEPRMVEGDADSDTVDGRLHNEDDREHPFDVTITDESGSSRDGRFEVGPDSTTRIPGVGSPGDVLTVDATVANAEVSETLELGGSAEPGELAGFLDVVYHPDAEIEISFESFE